MSAHPADALVPKGSKTGNVYNDEEIKEQRFWRKRKDFLDLHGLIQ